jgi:hypothetical protein
MQDVRRKAVEEGVELFERVCGVENKDITWQ